MLADEGAVRLTQTLGHVEGQLRVPSRVQLRREPERIQLTGRGRVLAYVTAASGALAILQHLGLPTRPAKRAPIPSILSMLLRGLHR